MSVLGYADFKSLTHDVMGKTAVLAVALLMLASPLLVLHAPAEAAPPVDFQSTPIVTSGLDGPSGFEIAPDGRIFILERTGTVKIYKNGQLLTEPFAVMPSAATGDRGLIGIAFDPDYALNCYVYFYYTSSDDLLNRLVRYNACGDVGTDGPFVVYQTNSPSQELHVGGSVQFGPDGKLYLAVGDNGYPPNGQDLSNPHGKILRINKDGSIPADNPFYGQAGKLGEIWAYGMRNPWRFQFDPANGRLYGGDVGDYSWEEVNRIEKGGNYGWPLKEGYCGTNCEGTIPPIYAYAHNGFSAAVTGGPVYRAGMFPEQYQGDLFFADYAQGFIKHMDLDADGNSLGVNDFDLNAGSVVDLKIAPDGSMYYITYYPGRLYRVTYDTGNAAPVANATADITKGMEPLTVNFSSAGSYDPDGTALTYHWDFGDGTTSTAANPSNVYEAKGSYTVELTVSDGIYYAQAVPIVIQVGEPPTVNLSAPADGSTYKAGDEITYNAYARDAAGFDVNDADIITDVILHHDTHTHPFLDDLVGRANSFVIPEQGEASANTWYEIVTTATDTNGLTATDRVAIYPQVVNLTFTTNVTGVGVNIDGVPYPNPHATQGVVNFKRELSAAPIKQGADGIFYQFEGWSDGGAIRHFFATPAADATYSATYGPAPAFRAEYFDNTELTGTPLLTRTEPEINNNWEFGSPDASMPADNWSARYTKDQYFAYGRYKFTTATDDGVRLYVDGKLVIDAWYGQAASHTASLDLAEGMHEIKMEYFEAFGGAYARLGWDSTPDQPAAPTNFAAEYFNNATLTGTPSLSRTDAAIDFDWGGGSPDPDLPADNFSARWTKSETLAAGEYTFTVTADDGVRLYIDGAMVIDKWVDQAPTTYTYVTSLTEGSHTIKMEYYEKSGGAVAKLAYAKTAEPLPASAYTAKYWNLADGATPAIPATAPDLTRADTAIDFDWGGGSPDAAVNADRFVAEWTKTATFEDGAYDFTVTSDDGIRMYLDGELIIDRWYDQGGETAYTAEKLLAAGDHAIKVEYYENMGGAKVQFGYAKSATAVTGFTGEYWNLADGATPAIPNTAPTLTRTDAAIDFDWSGGSPSSAINPDNFVTRWTKTETIATSGAYEFTVTADDGVRLYIDGGLVLDKWIDQAPTSYNVAHSLAAGDHVIRMEYYEKSGGAVARLSYRQVATTDVAEYPTEGYSAKYWNITSGTTPAIPSRTADVTRLDPLVNFDWAGGSPDAAINTDYFVARWQHRNTAAGTYRFTVTADDGVRLYINGELILDKWVDQAPTTYTVDKTVDGPWDVAVEYYEKAGGAVAKFNYEQVTAPAPITGFAASYWNTPGAGTAPAMPTTAPDLTRTDAVIDFDWSGGSPDARIAADHFVARWVKQETLASGTYRFTTTSDDGIRVYVNGLLVIDQWNDHAPTTHTGDVTLAEGTHEIRVEYYENAGGAVARMSYTLLSGT